MMGSFTLSIGQRRRVQRALRTTAEARVYRRLLALWQVAQGQSVAEVAARVGVCRQSLYHWLTRYQQTADPAALQDRARPGRPSRWTAGALRTLRTALQRAPDRFGYWAVNWTVPLLIEHVARQSGVRVSDETMRRQVHRLGYVWKRPRYVLAADPEREKKAPDPAAPDAAGVAHRRAGRG
jgi:transposase